MNKNFWTAAGFILANIALTFAIISMMLDDYDTEINQLENRVDELYRIVWVIERGN